MCELPTVCLCWDVGILPSVGVGEPGCIHSGRRPWLRLLCGDTWSIHRSSHSTLERVVLALRCDGSVSAALVQVQETCCVRCARCCRIKRPIRECIRLL